MCGSEHNLCGYLPNLLFFFSFSGPWLHDFLGGRSPLTSNIFGPPHENVITGFSNVVQKLQYFMHLQIVAYLKILAAVHILSLPSTLTTDKRSKTQLESLMFWKVFRDLKWSVFQLMRPACSIQLVWILTTTSFWNVSSHLWFGFRKHLLVQCGVLKDPSRAC